MPLWASNYGANPKTSYRNAYPGDSSSRWDKYSGQVPALLQYGSETIIAGQRRCDANAFRGTIDQLVKLVYPSGDGDAMAEVPTAKEIVDELLARDMGYSVQRDLSLRTLLLNLHQQGKQPFEDWGQTALLREAINRPQVEAAPVDPAALAAALQDPQTVQAIANAVADTLHARMAE
jgi:hypothetical protein